MIKVSTTGMVVSLKTDLRFPIPGQQGHGGRIIHPKYEFLSESILKSVDFSCVAEMYDERMITDEDIAEKFTEIIAKKEFSIVESWDSVKKAKWFLAIRWLLIILMFLGSPVIDKVKDNTLDALGVNDFWKESGIYEWLDEVFDIKEDGGVVSETVTKSGVSKNVCK